MNVHVHGCLAQAFALAMTGRILPDELLFTTTLQEATPQHTFVHSMVCCQAAAGLHSTQGCSLHSSVSSSQLQANSNHALPRVPPLFTSGRGEGFHGSHELACKREVRLLDAVGIPSFYFYIYIFGVRLEDTTSTARQDPPGAACTVSCKLLD